MRRNVRIFGTRAAALILHAEQSDFLAAKPSDWDKPRQDLEWLARPERLLEIGADAYLFQTLYDLDACTQDDMGNSVPQTWVEVQAFLWLSDLIKTNKVARLLRELSQA